MNLRFGKTQMLKVKNLSFKYAERSVFIQWEHSFSSGVTWIKGNNGSGKTVRLQMV
jgi:ABC-type transport system involved in cytochrome c biogenesis ATPase subunit